VAKPVARLQFASDPDNIFLERADAARADYLITGNPKHFPRFSEEHQDHTAGNSSAPH
jgi:predicted nucleic acid-binding protein